MEDLIYTVSFAGGSVLALMIYWGLLAIYHKGWKDGFDKGCGK